MNTDCSVDVRAGSVDTTSSLVMWVNGTSTGESADTGLGGMGLGAGVVDSSGRPKGTVDLRIVTIKSATLY